MNYTISTVPTRWSGKTLYFGGRMGWEFDTASSYRFRTKQAAERRCALMNRRAGSELFKVCAFR
jgi:hypothetical protein